jgi:hypothetical protein
LKEPQLATTFAHQALGVRAALLENEPVRKCILAMILHDKVHSEALAISHDANSVTLHANPAEGFNSTVLDELRQRRTELDPLHDLRYVEDHAAYAALKELSAERLDALIDLLTAECITAHLQRRAKLVWQLATELGVQVRRYWRPDERWLSSYQKIQLAHLIGELRGPVYFGPAAEKKKSDLIIEIAKLFADAAEGKVQDERLAERLNTWLPSNLREAQPTDKLSASAA